MALTITRNPTMHIYTSGRIEIDRRYTGLRIDHTPGQTAVRHDGLTERTGQRITLPQDSYNLQDDTDRRQLRIDLLRAMLRDGLATITH